MSTTRDFLSELEKRAKEQARLNDNKYLPEELKPLASLIGLHTAWVLFGSSVVIAMIVSIVTFPFIMRLYEKGVLAWLLGR